MIMSSFHHLTGKFDDINQVFLLKFSLAVNNVRMASSPLLLFRHSAKSIIIHEECLA